VSRNLGADARLGAGDGGGNPDAIIAVSDISIGALKAVSNSAPIVMSFGTGDPVAAGFASSIRARATIGPFATAEEADEMCNNLKAAGGQCVVQRN
jgi:hypothetical protein